MSRPTLVWCATVIALVACHVPAAVLLGAAAGQTRPDAGIDRLETSLSNHDCGGSRDDPAASAWRDPDARSAPSGLRWSVSAWPRAGAAVHTD